MLQELFQVLIYFNPRSPCGERRQEQQEASSSRYFNPRSPCGERRATEFPSCSLSKFQSTLPVWGATLFKFYPTFCILISIHAPRVGSDSQIAGYFYRCTISIHAPRVGSDVNANRRNRYAGAFQSTLPVWGATLEYCTALAMALFQSTLPVWGATNLTHFLILSVLDFNPRSPCGERPTQYPAFSTVSRFQSTLPVWGATAKA